MHGLRLPAPGQYRAGELVLSLFAAPLNALVLRALSDGPLRIGELRERVGGHPETTLRARIVDLIDLGAVAKIEQRAMPHSVGYELLTPGGGLLGVTDVLESWLRRSPRGPIEFGTDRAKVAVRGLASGWSAAILRALATEARTLTELDDMIDGVAYHTLERHLGTMRVAGQVEAQPIKGKRGTPYVVTDWLREGIGPLAAAGRWERRWLSKETDPVTWVEVEASFLLTLAIVKLPARTSGECVLAVDTKEAERRVAGVRLFIEKGQVVSASPELPPEPANFALGSAKAWMDAVIEGTAEPLRIRGDRKLVVTVVEALHKALFEPC